MAAIEDTVAMQPQSTSFSSQIQVHKNYLCTYDLYGPEHNCFDAGRYIMWGGGGRGVGAGIREFLGPLK
jgi:hypothetical protein